MRLRGGERSQKVDDLLGNGPVFPELIVERGELGLSGEVSKEEEIRSLFESGVFGKFEGIQAAVNEPTLRAVNIPDSRLARDGALQARFNLALDRPIDLGGETGFRLSVRFLAGLFLGFTNNLCDAVH